MGDEHVYCDVCDKVIPFGTTYFTLSAMTEHFIADDQQLEVDGIAESIFTCHEACIPETFTADLSRFRSHRD